MQIKLAAPEPSESLGLLRPSTTADDDDDTADDAAYFTEQIPVNGGWCWFFVSPLESTATRPSSRVLQPAESASQPACVKAWLLSTTYDNPRLREFIRLPL